MFRICMMAIAILLLAGCGSDGENERTDGFSDVAKTPEDSLFQEVMHGHDTAMAKMGKLKGYQEQFQQKIDSVKKLKSAGARTIESAYASTKQKLKDAETGMNKWMDEFQIDSAQDNMEQRLKYLADEKIRVEKVRDQIFDALREADSLMERK